MNAKRFTSGCAAWFMAYLAACYTSWLVDWLGESFFWGTGPWWGCSEYVGTPAPAPSSTTVPAAFNIAIIVCSPVTVPLRLLIGLVTIPLGFMWPECRIPPGRILLEWVSFLLPFVIAGLIINAIIRRRQRGAVPRPTVPGPETPEKNGNEANEGPKGVKRPTDPEGEK